MRYDLKGIAVLDRQSAVALEGCYNAQDAHDSADAGEGPPPMSKEQKQ
jgi:hypothetical protein